VSGWCLDFHHNDTQPNSIIETLNPKLHTTIFDVMLSGVLQSVSMLRIVMLSIVILVAVMIGCGVRGQGSGARVRDGATTISITTPSRMLNCKPTSTLC